MLKNTVLPLVSSAVMSLSAIAQTVAPAELKLDLGSGMNLEVVLIQPGSFEQGSPASEAGRETDETQRPVTLSRAFYMAKYPVTRGQFSRFIQTVRYKTEAEQGTSGGFGVVNGKLVQQKQFTWRNPGFVQTDEHPVVMVTVQDAQAFCRWLSTRTGRDCKLPTEAQWEYACRAGTTSAHYAEPVDDVAWYRGNSDAQTHPVGQKKPNAWGLYDLYGPVWQWCGDWYAPYGPPPATDPLQTNSQLSDKPRQVLRGGSFLSDVNHSRSAERYRNDARSRNADNGFRIVCSVNVRPAPPPKTESERQLERPDSPSKPLPRTSAPAPTTPNKDFDLGPPTQNRGFSLLSLVFIIPGMLVVSAIVFAGYKIIRAILSSFGSRSQEFNAQDLTPSQAADALAARPPPIAQRFAFRMSDSGFYISGPADAVGSVIHYTADLGERVLTDEITFTPGPEGQFIFTGMRPKSVTVRSGSSELGSAIGMASSSLQDDDEPRSLFRSSSTRRSHPSAY